MVGRVAEVRTRLQCNLNLPLHRGFESRTIRIGNNNRKPGTQIRRGTRKRAIMVRLQVIVPRTFIPKQIHKLRREAMRGKMRDRTGRRGESQR